MYLENIELKDSIEWIRNYDWLPSVTGILSLIVDPTFDMLKSNPDFDRIMKEACKRWTAVHEFIENTLLDKPCKIEEQYKWFIKQFLIYNVSQQYDRIELERFIKSETFWWTIDCIEYENNIVTLKDWKTAKQKPTGMMLQKYKMQLWWYYLLERNITDAELVIFTENKTYIYEFNEIELYKFAQDFWEILQHYYKIYDNTDSIPRWVQGHTWANDDNNDS